MPKDLNVLNPSHDLDTALTKSVRHKRPIWHTVTAAAAATLRMWTTISLIAGRHGKDDGAAAQAGTTRQTKEQGTPKNRKQSTHLNGQCT